MNIVDLILVIVIAVVAIASAKKGFLMTLFNIASFVVAGFLSKIFASPVAVYAYDGYFSEKVLAELHELMPSGSVEGEIMTVVSDAIETLPTFVQSMISHFGILDFTQNTADGASELTAEIIENTYLSPVVTNALEIIATVLLFVLFAFLLRIVFSFINKVFTKKKHKFIRGTNMFLGAAFGALKGTAISAVIAAVLNIAVPVINNANLTDFVNGSAICNMVAEILK